MEIPTGPAVVGLERTVLPCMVEGGTRQVSVTAPVCRYGDAYYEIHAEIVEPEGFRSSEVFGFPLEGGQAGHLSLGPSKLHSVELELVELELSPGALDGLTVAELTDALSHHLPEVRTAALLALGR